MNKFWSSLLGSFLGTWIAFLLSGVIMFVCVVIMMASFSVSSLQTPVRHVTDNSILRIDLAGAFPERQQSRQIADYIEQLSVVYNNLHDVLAAIKMAETDSKISGIYLYCGGLASGHATAKTLRDALSEFKRNSGKWVYAYGESSIGQTDYYVASVADSIFMNPVGMLDIHGLTSTTMFYKGLFDKLGIEMQIVRVGSFKSAVEPMMRTSMSEENRMQTKTYITNLWTNMCDSISAVRHISTDSINAYADRLEVFDSPEKAIRLNLIDGICYAHEFEDRLCRLTGADNADALNYVIPSEYVATQNNRVTGNEIAVLYATGTINVAGSTDNVNSDDMVPLILNLAEDENVKGLVLRVNSPGGSAYASEQIWEALEQFKQSGKPLAVSMGDYAASGGYYISCGADRIFAEPTTITGSIGIYGMIPSFEKLAEDKLGLTFESVSTNANVDMSLFKTMTPYQQAAMQRMVDNGYALFTRRCAEGRDMPLEYLKNIAEGRVWDAQEAKRIGLVDEFGSIDDAIDWIADSLHLDSSEYSIRAVPEITDDWMSILYSTLTYTAAEQKIAEQLGSLSPWAEEIRRILKQDKLQCRMDYIHIE